MAGKKTVKTNAMRMLDMAKIKYEIIEYEVDENDLSGTHIAEQIGLPFEQVFKTLVAKGDKSGVVVFCIPVDREIDLKKAAVVTGNKKLEMLHVKDLLGTTGYIRGGCSPIGMKKKFPTFIDESATEFDEITVSAGVRGAQLLLNVDELVKFVEAKICQIT
jgi:Cys-tRNA(Pro)/Cys-tRNA(Cys) deacylase